MAAKEISDAMRKEMDAALDAAGIWPLNSFGWLDADTADPEFIGHAMWQVEPPVDVDWMSFSAKRPFRDPTPAIPIIETWIKTLAVSGADFEGLMKAARMSIGLFLVEAQVSADAAFVEDDLRELHRVSAILNLATASDRMRDFLIAAAFHVTAADYLLRGKFYNGQRRAWYATPFIEAADALHTAALKKLQSMAVDIQVLRRARNKLIHEITTSMARYERSRLDSGKSVKAERSYNSYQELQALIAERRRQFAAQMGRATEELRDWYFLLVHASSQAFEFENRWRRQNL